MKNKIALLVACCLFLGCFSSCGGSSPQQDDTQIREIYKLYQESGGTMTYEEWLKSIKGEKGDPGEDGKDGKDGVSVVSILKTGSLGLVDTYTIVYSNGSTTTFTVTNGAQGIQGIQGQPGKDGVTPTITVSANNTWVINGTDTQIPLTGPKGEDGISVVSIVKTGTSGLVDTYTITYSDQSTTTFTVTNGAQGIQGIQGQPGKDGVTPTITVSANNTWVINGTDTQIPLTGPKGEDGYSFLTGNGVPSSELGKDGDTYLDYDTGNFYHKDDNQWTFVSNINDSNKIMAKGVYEESLDWKITTDGVLYISQLKECTSNGMYGYPWGSFFAFVNKVVFNEGVTRIPDGCFYSRNSGVFSNLEKVVLPNSLTSIGAYAFSYCVQLKEIDLPSNLVSIGNGVFSGCELLTSISIPDAVTSIGTNAFSGCGKLTSITLPNNLEIIGDSAFSSCSSLTNIFIPQGVNYIGSNAFFGDSNLTICCEGESKPISWNSNWNMYGNDGDYLRCPTAWSAIDYGTYNNFRFAVVEEDESKSIAIFGLIDKNVSSIEIPASIEVGEETILVKSIANNAFANCSSATSLVIPSCIETIGKYVTYGCTNLIIYCEAEEQPSGWDPDWNIYNCPTAWGYIGIHGVQSNLKFALCKINDTKCITIIGVDDTSASSINVPEYMYVDSENIPVTIIGASAFEHANNSLRNISLPNTLKYIGSCAFSGCAILESITIPGNAVLGTGLFQNCYSLRSVTLSDGITSIPKGTFYQCQSLSSINIPNTVVSIEYGAFWSCGNLREIAIPSSVAYMDSNVFTKCTQITVYCEAESKPAGWDINWVEPYVNVVWGCSGIRTYNNFQYQILTSGGNKAITICGLVDKNVSSINIPSSINVDGINIPVTSIKEESFVGCKNLTSANISNSVTFIGQNAFGDCFDLRKVIIPQSVQIIQNRAFGGCYMASIYCEAESQPSGWDYNWCEYSSMVTWNSSGAGEYENFTYLIRYNNGLKYIELTNFEGESVSSVSIPSYICVDGNNITVKAIGERLFANCSDLTSVSIPDSITFIGDYAFYECSSLQSVDISDNVNYLGKQAFYECISLISASIGSNVFINDAAFEGCSSLKSVTINDGVSSINQYAFHECSSLEEITIPSSVSSIGDYAFASCSLEDVTLSNGINSIGNYAFGWNNSLTALFIPSSVTSMGKYICSSSSAITFYCAAESEPAGWDSDWNQYQPVYWGCSEIQELDNYEYVIYLDDGEKKLHIYRFTDGIATSVNIPSSILIDEENIPVSSIGYKAFDDLSFLIAVFIPDSIECVERYAFYNCENASIYCEASSKPEQWEDEWAYDVKTWSWSCSKIQDDGTLKYVVISEFSSKYICIVDTVDKDATSIAIPPSMHINDEDIPVYSIRQYAFSECENLESVSIPICVYEIIDNAFIDCPNLTIYCEADSQPFNWESNWNPDNRPVVWGSSGLFTLGSFNYQVFYNGGSRYATVIGCNDSMLTSAEIPAYIQIYGKSVPVTSIGDGAFSGCDNLISVSLPSGLLSIGDNAFYNCSSLQSINIPYMVGSIGANAFTNCFALNDIIIPINVTSIGDNAFLDCYVNTIYCEASSKPNGWSETWNASNRPVVWNCSGPGTYQNYEYLTLYNDGNRTITITNYLDKEATSISVPSSILVNDKNVPVTAIGDSAFYECTKLSSLTLPESLTSIGNYSFAFCSSLNNVDIPNSVASLGEGSFSECSSLESVSLPSSLLSIGNNAFKCCFSLTNVTLPDSLASIGNFAFYRCQNMKSITIPASVTNVGKYAFNPSNTAILYCEASSKPEGWSNDWNTSHYKVIWNCSGEGCYNSLNYIVYHNGGDRTITITGISDSTITDVNIPSTILFNNKQIPVTSIAEKAFYNNTSIKTVSISNNVVSIGSFAFMECSSLASIELSSNLTSIGQYAFSNCTKLKSITIPSQIKSIDIRTFYHCSSLESVSLSYGLKIINSGAFYNCLSLKSIAIPSSVTTIASEAFYNCSSLESISIPSGVTAINSSTFSGCSNLASVTIPNGVETIGEYAFSKCAFITINLPESITSIGQSAFSYCKNLKSITIPSKVTSIEDETFSCCESLESITLPEGLTYIGDEAFLSDGELKQVSFPNTLVSIGNEAFRYCYLLTSIDLPDSLLSIGDYTFSGCEHLSAVIIPSSVVSVGKDVFNGWFVIYCEAMSKPDGWSDEWNINNSHVTWGCVDNRKTESFWYGVIDDGINKSIVIIECLDYEATNIAIPSFFNVNDVNLPVTVLGGYSFSSCESAVSVEIPDSVKTIGYSAFNGVQSLKSIRIPNSVTSIERGAFYLCYLEYISIPISVQTIGNNAIWIEVNDGCIYCEATSKPEGWSDTWNGENGPVIWNCSGIYTCDNLEYVVYYNDGDCTAEITSCLDKTITTLNVPSTFNFDGREAKVISIADKAFEHCSSLVSISLPNTLENIGKSAFRSCSSLVSISIPNNINEIKEYTFYDCTSLKNVVIPDTLISIGDYAFARTKIEAINLGNKLESIGSLAFSDTSELKSIVIPNTVVSIGTHAFHNSGIESVTLSNNLTAIENYTFFDCVYLKSINIPDSVLSIGAFAFGDCASLSSVTIPSTVASIGSYGFCNCEDLMLIYIPSSVVSIDSNAFYGCNVLTIYSEAESKPSGWSETWNSFDRPVFWNCVETGVEGQFDYVVVSNNEEKSVIISRYNNGTESEILIPSVIKIDDKDIPVVAISDFAFSNIDQSVNVVIPHSVDRVSEYSFIGCPNATFYCEAESRPASWSSNWNVNDCPVVWNSSGIGNNGFFDYLITYNNGQRGIVVTKFTYKVYDDITIPSTINVNGIDIPVTGIGDSAFKDADNLLTINTGANVTTIGDYAFKDCVNLSKVTFGNNVVSIGTMAFSGCAVLESITFPESLVSIGDCAFSSCCLIESLIIPDSVTSIGSYSFAYCTSLVSLEIGNGVQTIGDYAFSYCSNLTDVTFGDNIVSIGVCAFFDCGKLSSADLKNTNLTSIGDCAFQRCSELTFVFIPDSVDFMGINIFSCCDILTIYCAGDSAKEGWDSSWNSSDRPVIWSCQKLGEYDVFNYAVIGKNEDSYILILGVNDTTITSLNIPSSINVDGNEISVKRIYDYAFKDCQFIETVKIPENITYIGQKAFEKCSSLDTVYIPKSVSYIGYAAFNQCHSELMIFCEAESRPDGWDQYWTTCGTIVWGYTPE